LNFGRCEIQNDAPLEALANSLTNMNDLRELSVEFFSCKITDNAFNAFSESLNNKPKIKILALGFGKTKLYKEDTL
jgi:hypothetical protein